MSNVLALCRIDEHSYLHGQSMRLEVLNLKITDHLALLLNTMYHVQCVTLQHGELLWWFLHNIPAHHSGPQEYYGYLMAMVIFVQCLNVLIETHSQYLAAQQTEMELYSTTLRWSAIMEFPAHIRHTEGSHMCGMHKVTPE